MATYTITRSGTITSVGVAASHYYTQLVAGFSGTNTDRLVQSFTFHQRPNSSPYNYVPELWTQPTNTGSRFWRGTLLSGGVDQDVTVFPNIEVPAGQPLYVVLGGAGGALGGAGNIGTDMGSGAENFRYSNDQGSSWTSWSQPMWYSVVTGSAVSPRTTRRVYGNNSSRRGRTLRA